MIKFKVIFLPFLLTLVCVVVTLTAIRWGLDIKLGIINVKEMVLDFFIPSIVSVIAVLILMRKRLRVLDFKKDNTSSFYKMLMAVAIAIPACISQALISSASYELIELNSVDSIKTLEKEKYFKFQEYQVNPDKAAYDITYRVTGKHNQNFDMTLYIAVPFESQINAWYGVSFYKQISNRLDDKEKEAKRDAFVSDSAKKFSEYQFYEQEYFELLKASDRREGLKSAIDRKQPHRKNLPAYILRPHKGKFAERDSGTFKALFWFTLIPAFIIYLLLLAPKVSDSNLSKLRNGSLEENDATSKVIRALSFRSGSPSTALIQNLCIVAFLACVFVGVNPVWPTALELVPVGGVRRDLVLSGEYWRLISAVFLHAGFIHLLMNSFVLAIAGRILEPSIGSVKFLFVFLFSGVVASLISISWHPSTISVGASGAIYGLLGALIVLTFNGFIPKPKRADVWMISCLVIVSGLVMGVVSNIDHAAHLGGFLAGLFCGWLMMGYLKVNNLKEC